jgi:hypothetical protein
MGMGYWLDPNSLDMWPVSTHDSWLLDPANQDKARLDASDINYLKQLDRRRHKDEIRMVGIKKGLVRIRDYGNQTTVQFSADKNLSNLLWSIYLGLREINLNRNSTIGIHNLRDNDTIKISFAEFESKLKNDEPIMSSLVTSSIDKTLQTTLQESSLSRLYHHMHKPFAIMSAFRGGNTKAQNIARHHKLQQHVKSMGLSYVNTKGMWKECPYPDTPYEQCPEEELVPRAERSLFIIGISRKQAQSLGEAYNQDAVIWGSSPDNVYLISGNNLQSIGSFRPQVAAAIWTKIDNKTFTFESVADDFGSALIEKYMKPIC